MEKARINGVETAYELRGAGVPLVMIHGAQGDQSMFKAGVAWSDDSDGRRIERGDCELCLLCSAYCALHQWITPQATRAPPPPSGAGLSE